MSIRIVSHCYAKELPHFAACLNYQLASLFNYKPECEVHMVVCCTPDDEMARRVADSYQYLNELEPNPTVSQIQLSPENLFRRAIGRNQAALESTEDIVWFTDCDHLFREGCLDTLDQLEWPEGASLVFPRNIKIHKDHATGDKLTRRFDWPVRRDVNEEDFIDKRYTRAIGPAQIVRGDFAREHGYLKDTKWMEPNPKPFGDFRDDIAFRRVCMKLGTMKGIDLPNIYRIRHTKTTYH